MGIKNDLMGRMDFRAIAERLLPTISRMGQELIRSTNWIVLVICLIALPLLARGGVLRRLRRMLVLLGGPGLYCLGMLTIYMGTPNKLSWHLDTSVTRVMLGVLPMLFAATVFVRTGPARTGPAETQQISQADRPAPPNENRSNAADRGNRRNRRRRR